MWDPWSLASSPRSRAQVCVSVCVLLQTSENRADAPIPEATLNIHTVDQQPSRDFQGCIRAQDIRATEKDKVKVWLSFRPGDLVQARVLSLGDARSYFLSTAERHLGVLYAVSADGRPMQAVAWDTMRDTLTGDEERRKVAGPSP